MGTLILEMAGLGLAAALTSPGSVVTVIALLSMSAGIRRGLAFICGWVIAIGLIALLVTVLLRGQDFSSRHTTPSRAASIVEVLLGALLLVISARAHRRPHAQPKHQSQPAWLERIDRSHWLLEVPVGAIMLSYTLTLAAAAEALKADPGTLDASVAGLVFAATSIVTIVAPVALVLYAPDRATRVLAAWRNWAVTHSRGIVLISLVLIGVLLVVRGVHDLVA